jgi:hypothetical protein
MKKHWRGEIAFWRGETSGSFIHCIVCSERIPYIVRCVFAKYESVFEGMQRWRDKLGARLGSKVKILLVSAAQVEAFFTAHLQKKIHCRFWLNPAVKISVSLRLCGIQLHLI